MTRRSTPFTALRRCLPILAAVAALAALAPPPAAQSAGPVQALSHKSLDAVAWVQSAAEWEALTRQAFRAASVSLRDALDDESITAALEQPSAPGLPPAVILDVDETVLDNSFYQARLIRDGGSYERESWHAWCREVAAPTIPGALEFCREAASLGVTVFYVTNRRDDVREPTRENLALHGFPLRDDIETVLTRGDSSDKAKRRRAIAETHRIVMLVGDNLGDFASVFREQTPDARRALVAEHAEHWGDRWIVLPNPMYGDWMGAIMGYDFGLTPMTEMKRLRGALRPDSILESVEAAKLPARAAASERVAEPAAFTSPLVPMPPAAPQVEVVTPDVTPRHPKLSSGPMPGWSAVTESSLWVQTSDAADVQFLYHPSDRPADARLTPTVRTDASGDHIATVVLADLEPGTRYDVALFLDGERVALAHPVHVQTQPLWLWRGQGDLPHAPPEFSFTFGSCSYVNDPPHDRPGRPYGGGYEIYDTIAATSPAFMLWLGDNIYLRAADWLTEDGIRRRYRTSRAAAPLQRLLGATHHYATWDDHDYGYNDSDRSFPLRDETAGVFADYWPSVALGDDEGRGVFQRFSWGDCEFFMLDDRTWRSPNVAPETADKRMFGRAQMQWLKDALISSRATFKFIVNGNQLTNPVANFEGFGRFPAEQAELFAFLQDRQIEGLVFLSGDRHHSELLVTEPFDGCYPWLEFTSSPLSSGVFASDEEADNPARVPGTLVNDRRSFGRVTVRGPFGTRVLVLSAHDAAGNELWRYEVAEGDLRFDC